MNSNIRCIEIEIMSLVAGAIAKLNSNIRCIEMLRNVSLGGQGES